MTPMETTKDRRTAEAEELETIDLLSGRIDRATRCAGQRGMHSETEPPRQRPSTGNAPEKEPENAAGREHPTGETLSRPT